MKIDIWAENLNSLLNRKPITTSILTNIFPSLQSPIDSRRCYPRHSRCRHRGRAYTACKPFFYSIYIYHCTNEMKISIRANLFKWAGSKWVNVTCIKNKWHLTFWRVFTEKLIPFCEVESLRVLEELNCETYLNILPLFDYLNEHEFTSLEPTINYRVTQFRHFHTEPERVIDSVEPQILEPPKAQLNARQLLQ